MFRLGAQKRAESAEEDSEVIRNSVLVCIIKTHLILLKEQWDRWKFFKSSKDEQGRAVNKELKEYKKTAEKRSREARPTNESNTRDAGPRSAASLAAKDGPLPKQ